MLILGENVCLHLSDPQEEVQNLFSVSFALYPWGGEGKLLGQPRSAGEASEVQVKLSGGQ